MTDALAVVGERYTLPIVREIEYGNRRFNELAALTGAPRSLLTNRLRTLEQAGILQRRRYQEHPPRFEYLLTAAGHDLLPAILAFKEWGDRHCRDGEPTAVLRHSCGAELHPLTVCAACREPVAVEDLQVAGGSHPPVFRAG